MIRAGSRVAYFSGVFRMKIKTRCEHCGKVYQMDDHFAGQIAQCRHCQKYFTMTPFEDQPAPAPFRVSGQGPPPGPIPGPGPSPIPGPGPASQTFIETQTIACPKCGFTAALPRFSHKLKLKCQGCGHKFVAKPEPKVRRPPEKTPREGGFSKTTALLLLILVLAAGLLVAGPKFFPKLRALGWPDIPGSLPF